MFSLNVLSMITLKYSTQALSRLVCAYTVKLPHVWDISRTGGGGGSHEQYCQNTGQRRADQCDQLTSHIVFNMIIYITQVGLIEGVSYFLM